MQLKDAQIKRKRFFDLLGGGEVIPHLLQDGSVILPFGGRLLKNIVETRRLFRIWFGVWFQNNRAVKPAKSCPEGRIVVWHFGGAIESFEGPFFIAGGEIDLKQSLVAVNFLRIQRNGFVGEFNRLIAFL